jgi:large subunit ribosomal protein L15
MRLPKRGFHNKFRVDYALVNVQDLAVFDEGAEIGPIEIKKAGLMRRNTKSLKILGEGELDKALVVKAHAFSQSAKEKIEAAGGKAEVI